MPTRRLGLLIAGAVVLVAAAHAVDQWAVTGLAIPSANDRDWGRMLRIMGYAPTWLLVAALFWLESRRSIDRRHLARTAVAIVAAIALAGLGAEGVKLLVRRGRPDPAVHGYLFRAFADHPFSTKALGFPSSHAAVAFGAAGALGRRFRGAAPVLFAAAAGCGLTRVFATAHFVSDVAGGAVIGAATGWWLSRRLDPVPEAG